MQTERNRTLTVVFVVLSLLAVGQIMAAAKKSADKEAQARVIYSGQFKGHVEPCG